jgi:hypothetical protein
MKNANEYSCFDDKENLLLQHEIETMKSIMKSKSKYQKIIHAGIAR